MEFPNNPKSSTSLILFQGFLILKRKSLSFVPSLKMPCRHSKSTKLKHNGVFFAVRHCTSVHN